MVKLQEYNGQAQTLEMIVQKHQFSTGTKTTSNVGFVVVNDDVTWHELNFNMNTWADMEDYEAKFYIRTADTTVSYAADHAYLTDEDNLVEYTRNVYKNPILL